MRIKLVTLIVLFLVFILLQGCGNIVSTEKLNEDLKTVNVAIEKTKNESAQYIGGLIKTLIDLRLETLKNTEAMLEQKKKGLNRFITIKYTIEGEPYKRPEDFIKQMEQIQLDIAELKQNISETQAKSDQYYGGLIKNMIDLQIEQLKNTLVLLEQKRLSLKHDMPIYFSSSTSSEEQPARKAMEGSDLDNL